MALKTRKRLCKAQGQLLKPIDPTPSRLPSFFGGLDKLAGTQTPFSGPSTVPTASPRPPNVPAAASAGAGASPSIYLNEGIQDII